MSSCRQDPEDDALGSCHLRRVAPTNWFVGVASDEPTPSKAHGQTSLSVPPDTCHNLVVHRELLGGGNGAIEAFADVV
jgi:hypothetical protein